MAFVVFEVTGRGGKEEEKPQASTTRAFRVITDSLAATAADVLAASGIPALYSLHPANPVAMVVGRDAKQSNAEDEPYVWDLTLAYSTSSRYRTDPATRNPDPTQRPAEISIDFEEIETGLMTELEPDAELDDQYGWNGSPKPVANSAGDPFDPPPTDQETIGIITIERGLPSVDFGQLMDFNNSTNLKKFLNFDPDVLKIKLRAKRAFENNQFYWAVTAALHVRPIYFRGDSGWFGGWQGTYLDAGYRKKVGDDLVKIRDKHGDEVTRPALLNGTGDEQVPGGQPRFRRFHSRKRRDFNLLKLL